jgi:hypothetical protein
MRRKTLALIVLLLSMALVSVTAQGEESVSKDSESGEQDTVEQSWPDDEVVTTDQSWPDLTGDEETAED